MKKVFVQKESNYLMEFYAYDLPIEFSIGLFFLGDRIFSQITYLIYEYKKVTRGVKVES
ncbi:MULTISPECIES: hypothetical protein [Cytobacillus]|uniref:hypothetical protein n=1 Tax=Cytobacillus TaxID=2675230 RepID=UPI00135CB784|nr:MULTISPECIES: hypothetical protein [Cytobacillus]KAF0818092.1 hypothetical protein KIS4809_2894 [Bacillus sp. ZZV12-4809]MCM3094472.1 hypothetical protein [Cytobacillus sp. AMY 15.2]MCM3406032.1 hypothetical protein [Cytobacillus oceanisediminis]